MKITGGALQGVDINPARFCLCVQLICILGLVARSVGRHLFGILPDLFVPAVGQKEQKVVDRWVKMSISQVDNFNWGSEFLSFCSASLCLGNTWALFYLGQILRHSMEVQNRFLHQKRSHLTLLVLWNFVNVLWKLNVLGYLKYCESHWS